MDVDDTGTGFGQADQPTGVSGPLPDDAPSGPRERLSRASGGGRRGGRGGRPTGRRGGSGGGSGDGPRRPRPSKAGGAAALQKPAVRIALAVVGLVIVILILTLAIQSCRRGQLEDSYKSYMGEVTTVVGASVKEGDALQEALANKQGQTPQELQVQVRDIATQAQGLVGQAEGLSPPDTLSAPNQSLVTALQYRVTGLRALADSLPSVVDSKNRAYSSATLASAMQRFLASDIIYQDSFVGPAKRALAAADVTGVQVPDRDLFLSGVRADQASPTGAAQLIPALQRTGGSATTTDSSGGVHGTGIVSVQALPAGVDLTADSETTLKASDKLQWQITVENAGDFQENAVIVRATFASVANPKDAQTVEKEIPQIAPGSQQPVTLPGPKSPTFGEAASLKVEVVPVPNEKRTDNNRAEYPIKIVF